MFFLSDGFAAAAAAAALAAELNETGERREGKLECLAAADALRAATTTTKSRCFFFHLDILVVTFINTQPINATDEKGRVAPRATTTAKHPFIRTGRRLWNIQHSFLLFYFGCPDCKNTCDFLPFFLPSLPRRRRAAFPQNQSEGA